MSLPNLHEMDIDALEALIDQRNREDDAHRRARKAETMQVVAVRDEKAAELDAERAYERLSDRAKGALKKTLIGGVGGIDGGDVGGIQSVKSEVVVGKKKKA